jgi:hypothetical protein
MLANLPEQIVTHERMQDEHAARTRDAERQYDSDRIAPWVNTPGWVEWERERYAPRPDVARPV